MKKHEPGMPLYAFWRDNTFPWVLGGPVTCMDADGKVETSNYGHGFRFTPVKLLPQAAGTALHERLNALAEERRAAVVAALAQINKTIDAKLNEMVPFASAGVP